MCVHMRATNNIANGRWNIARLALGSTGGGAGLLWCVDGASQVEGRSSPGELRPSGRSSSGKGDLGGVAQVNSTGPDSQWNAQEVVKREGE